VRGAGEWLRVGRREGRRVNQSLSVPATDPIERGGKEYSRHKKRHREFQEGGRREAGRQKAVRGGGRYRASSRGVRGRRR